MALSLARAAFAAALLAACTPVGAGVTAGSVAGTTAAQERPLGKAISDTGIRAEINYLWATKDLALFRKVELGIFEGRVLLTGAVLNPETRVEAARLAWEAAGVREVLNEIQVENDSAFSDRARDSWILTKLRTRLTLDNKILSVNYTLDVVNGTVYVIGIAQDDAELRRVMAHIKDLAYVRNVVTHVRMKDDPRRRA
jgi:osmotically-inducible protein OsmY